MQFAAVAQLQTVKSGVQFHGLAFAVASNSDACLISLDVVFEGRARLREIYGNRIWFFLPRMQ